MEHFERVYFRISGTSTMCEKLLCPEVLNNVLCRVNG